MKISNIEWCDSTWNPWEGCQKVGPGCDNCYAETRNARFAGGTAINWGPGAPRRRTSASNWQLPKRWNAQADAFMAQHGRRQRVFCASLADVFDNAVDPQWRADLFALIAATPYLDWLLLTKRIGNVQPMLAELANGNDPDLSLIDMMPLPNVWIGATITSQAEADRDIPKLLAVPARVRFLSMEPLLGPVDISKYMWPVCGWWHGPYNSYREAKAAGAECGLKRQGLVGAWVRFVDWIIVGGESGPGARPMHPDWASSLRDQCQAAGVPFLFKQWGEWMPGEKDGETVKLTFPIDGPHGPVNPEFYDLPDGTCSARVGKKAAGRLLDGRTWDDFPTPRPK